MATRKFTIVLVKRKPSGNKEFKVVSQTRTILMISQGWRQLTPAEVEEAEEYFRQKETVARPGGRTTRFGSRGFK